MQFQSFSTTTLNNHVLLCRKFSKILCLKHDLHIFCSIVSTMNIWNGFLSLGSNDTNLQCTVLNVAQKNSFLRRRYTPSLLMMSSTECFFTPEDRGGNFLSSMRRWTWLLKSFSKGLAIPHLGKKKTLWSDDKPHYYRLTPKTWAPQPCEP
jgi:hypothetical protein